MSLPSMRARALGGLTCLCLLAPLASARSPQRPIPVPPPQPLAAAPTPRVAAPRVAAPRVAAPRVAAPRDDPARVARLLRDLRRDGRVDEALAMVAGLDATVAADPRVRGEHALALLAAGCADQAAQRIAGHPSRGPVPMPLAVAHTHLQLLGGDHDGARENLARMLADRPDHPDLLVLSVNLALVDGDYAAGNRAFEQVRPSLHPDLAAELEVALLRGRAMEMMASDELLERAVPLLERAHELVPGRADVIGLLARALARFQRTERAEELIEAALRDQGDAGRAELLYALGFVRRAQSRDAEAADAFRQVLSLQPGHAQARVGLARCELSRGDLDAARALVDEALQEQADDLDALLLLADIEGELRDWDAAGETLARLLEIKPRHLRGLWQLSRVRARQGRRDELAELVTRYETRKAQLEQTATAAR